MTIATRWLAAALGLGTALMMARDAGISYQHQRLSRATSEVGITPLEIMENLTTLPQGFRLTQSRFKHPHGTRQVRIEVDGRNSDGLVMRGSLMIPGMRFHPSKGTITFRRAGESAVCARLVLPGWFSGTRSRLEETGNCQVLSLSTPQGTEALHLAVRFHSDRASQMALR